MARPAISDERVTIADDNCIRLRFKTAWRDCTESLLFTPSEFIEKLIALVPIPRFHLTRYYSVLAPRPRHRRSLPDLPQPDNTPISASARQAKGQGKRKKGAQKRLPWAALLKRTSRIDVLTCGRCCSCASHRRACAPHQSRDSKRCRAESGKRSETARKGGAGLCHQSC